MKASQKKQQKSRYDSLQVACSVTDNDWQTTKTETADDKHKWEAAAAKHYDRTGQRITADQARKVAEDVEK